MCDIATTTVEVIEDNSKLLVPSPDIPLWKTLIAEFIGTFALVFIGAGTAALSLQQGGSVLAFALAFGLILMVMIYIIGVYSGGHYNPAVSFGFALTGRMNFSIMLAYWIVQLIAGIAAAALIVYLFGNAGASIGTLTYTNAWGAVLAEAVATFFFVLTILLVTRNPLLSLVAGIVIGLTLTSGIVSIGYLTGGSLNPARSLGPALFSNNIGSYWIYVIGPLLGALVAALFYKIFISNCTYKVDECGNQILNQCGNPIKECQFPIVDNCGNSILVPSCSN